MRIGALAQKYQLPIDTIRYYINSGLLVPNSKNKQYDFNEKDLDDLTLIIKLKNLYFSINDIHHILSLKRISNFEDLRDLKAFEQILTEHKNNLVQIHNNTQQIIDNLSKEISNLSENYKSKGETPFICSGVPLLFLPYLYCPSCHKPLSLKNATIENQQIFQGLLDCACGYQAKIENGILSTDKGHLAKGDVPDIERKYYKSMSSCCMTLFKKSYNWIFNQLIQENLQQKIIMENSINSFFFLLTHLECLNKDALYIVADNHPDIVVMYKKIIDNMNLHLNILYLSAGTLQYPLKENCVDFFIDYYATNDYATFYPGSLTDLLHPYFKQNYHYIGAYFFFNDKSPSRQLLLEKYPLGDKHNFQKSAFIKKLATENFATKEDAEIGAATDCGNAFSFHLNHEPIYLYCFHCRKNS